MNDLIESGGLFEALDVRLNFARTKPIFYAVRVGGSRGNSMIANSLIFASLTRISGDRSVVRRLWVLPEVSSLEGLG